MPVTLSWEDLGVLSVHVGDLLPELDESTDVIYTLPAEGEASRPIYSG